MFASLAKRVVRSALAFKPYDHIWLRSASNNAKCDKNSSDPYCEKLRKKVKVDNPDAQCKTKVKFPPIYNKKDCSDADTPCSQEQIHAGKCCRLSDPCRRRQDVTTWQSDPRLCRPPPENFCTKLQLPRDPCYKPLTKEHPIPDRPPFKSMWENPECCIDPCPQEEPRFDDLYYISSDKSTRVYQQTWQDCPEMKILPKVVCCFEQTNLAPPERRPPRCRPVTACPPDSETCPSRLEILCPKIRLPCCAPVRSSTKCTKMRPLTNCKKINSPFPAYSECIRPERKKVPPVECQCIKSMSMCEMWCEYRRRLLFHRISPKD